MDNLEEAVSLLANLASKSVLSRAELKKAKETMVSLRKAGMSTEEIAKLSKGRWTANTVRFYTKGVKAPDPGPWQDAISLLEKLISSGLTLDDVETAIGVFEELNSKDIALLKLVDLLAGADALSIDVTSLFQEFEELRESHLSLNNVSEALSIKKDLESKGLGLNSLMPLGKLAQNFGDADKVLEAVSNYGSLGQIQDQIVAAKKKLVSLGDQVASTQGQLEKIQASLSDLKHPLEAYKKAKELGFGEAELIKL
jgi:hypothetical protein